MEHTQPAIGLYFDIGGWSTHDRICSRAVDWDIGGFYAFSLFSWLKKLTGGGSVMVSHEKQDHDNLCLSWLIVFIMADHGLIIDNHKSQV